MVDVFRLGQDHGAYEQGDEEYSEEVPIELDADARVRTVDGTFEDIGYDYSQHFKVLTEQKFVHDDFIRYKDVKERRRVEVEKIEETDGLIQRRIGLGSQHYAQLRQEVANQERMAFGDPNIQGKMYGIEDLGQLDPEQEEVLNLLDQDDIDAALDALNEAAEEELVTSIDGLLGNITRDRSTCEVAQWGGTRAAVSGIPGLNRAPVRASPEEIAYLQALQNREDSDLEDESDEDSLFNDDIDLYSDEHDQEDVAKVEIEDSDEDEAELEYRQKTATFNAVPIGRIGSENVEGEYHEALQEVEDNLLDYTDEVMKVYISEKYRTDVQDRRVLAPVNFVGAQPDGTAIHLGGLSYAKKEDLMAKQLDHIISMEQRGDEPLVDTRIDVDNKPFEHDCETILTEHSNIYHRPTKIRPEDVKKTAVQLTAVASIPMQPATTVSSPSTHFQNSGLFRKQW